MEVLRCFSYLQWFSLRIERQGDVAKHVARFVESLTFGRAMEFVLNRFYSFTLHLRFIR